MFAIDLDTTSMDNLASAKTSNVPWGIPWRSGIVDSPCYRL
jgi:hypothetical protein